MITRFRVQNYKALRDVTLDLTPIHVLIGPNDTGKTSILEAFSAFCRSVDHRMSDAFAGGWTGRRLVWCGQANLPIVFDAVIEGGNGPCEYSLFCSFGADGRDVRIFEESIEASDGRVVASWQADRTSSNVRELASEGLPGLNEASRATRHVYESLKGVHLYRWNPEFLRLPVAPDSKRRFRMAPSGFGLAQCLDEILGDDRERFAELERRFRSIFPYVNSIKLVHEPAYHARSDECHGPPVLREAEGKGLYFDIEGLDNLLPASQVSDGVLLVLAYLCILCLPEPPRVLLVEEPENGVHPARLKDVLQILRELVKEQSHTQVIMTTHSPYVVDLFQPDEVTLCIKEDDGSISVRRLSESQKVREQIDVFTLGEIWTAEGDEAIAKSAAPENKDEPGP